MYSLIQSIRSKKLFIEQTASFGISFFIAELFYKFHSFTLECLGFLATWYILDAVTHLIKKSLSWKTPMVSTKKQ